MDPSRPWGAASSVLLPPYPSYHNQQNPPDTDMNFFHRRPEHPPHPDPPPPPPPGGPSEPLPPILHQPGPPPLQRRPDHQFAPNAAILYTHATAAPAQPPPAQHIPVLPPHPPPPPHDPALLSPDTPSGLGSNHYAPSNSIPRLPPILQVEKQQVTTSATQAASASRRRNEAHFQCPVPGCGSTFTRRFNLRGHLRSHTEERPYVCEWPGCNKGFARQHDCKRHQALHSARATTNICPGCKKTFSRLDALNRHLRSEGGADCRERQKAHQAASAAAPALNPTPSESSPTLSQPDAQAPTLSPHPVPGTPPWELSSRASRTAPPTMVMAPNDVPGPELDPNMQVDGAGARRTASPGGATTNGSAQRPAAS